MKLDELDWLVEDLLSQQEMTPKTIIYTPFVKSVNDVYNYIVTKLGNKAYKNEEKFFKNRLVGQYYAEVGETTKKHIQSEFCKEDSTIRIHAECCV